MLRGMQRARTAKGEQLEVAEIVTAHGGDRLDRLLHLHVDDADDAFGRVDRRPCRAVSATCGLDGALGRADVELHLAAEEIVLAEIAQHQVAVGDRGLRAAAAVAGGPGHGAGALRADFEIAEAITRASVPPPALTVLMSIIGSAMSRPSILPRFCTEGCAVLDQRDVAGRAAHVEGDEISETRSCGKRARSAVMPPAGAGKYRGHGFFRASPRRSPCRRSTA